MRKVRWEWLIKIAKHIVNIIPLKWLPTVSWKVKKCKFQPNKLPKVLHWITFRASSTQLIDKVLRLLQKCCIKMAENVHLIQFISQTSLVTPDCFCIKNSVDNLFYTRKIMLVLKKIRSSEIFFKCAYLALKLKEISLNAKKISRSPNSFAK